METHFLWVWLMGASWMHSHLAIYEDTCLFSLDLFWGSKPLQHIFVSSSGRHIQQNMNILLIRNVVIWNLVKYFLYQQKVVQVLPCSFLLVSFSCYYFCSLRLSLNQIQNPAYLETAPSKWTLKFTWNPTERNRSLLMQNFLHIWLFQSCPKIVQSL